LRVKLNGSNKLAVCGAGATETEVGTMRVAALAADEYVAVRLPTAMGTTKMVALTSFAREALLYAGAGGYVDDVVNGKPIGVALEAATALGDVVEVLRIHAQVIVTSGDVVDDAAISFGTSTDVQALFSTGDASNHAFVLALDNTSQQMHITDVGAKATDWNRGAGTHPELAIHSNTTPATDYLSIGNHDGTTATIDVVGGTTLALDIAGTTALSVTAAAVTVTGALVVTGNDLPTTAGVGITGAADNFASSVTKHGTLFKTTIVVDLDGLNSGGTAHDIIGADGAGVAHLGQITAARNGTIFAGTLTCIETPAGGDPDVDIWDAIEATGVEDTGIAALTGEHQLCNGGDLSAGTVVPLTVYPVANQYLYLTTEEVTDATYTAGVIIIELWGK
jgi:hypothetical protein